MEGTTDTEALKWDCAWRVQEKRGIDREEIGQVGGRRGAADQTCELQGRPDLTRRGL